MGVAENRDELEEREGQLGGAVQAGLIAQRGVHDLHVAREVEPSAGVDHVSRAGRSRWALPRIATS